MDLNRNWTVFAADAECDAYGTTRLCNAHNALRAENERLREQLRKIGDYAHDHSTGPEVPDALWEVRAMAYEG
jgi:hypothetical protein